MKNYREIFNPTKITISGKSHILTTQDGKYVVKEKKKDLKSLYNYLENRSFNKFPKIIDEYDNNYVYEYLDDINEPINQKMIDQLSFSRTSRCLGQFAIICQHIDQ